MARPRQPDDPIRQAADWFAQLYGGVPDKATQQAWGAWHEADPANRHAWQLVQEVRQQFDGLPPGIAQRSLEVASRSRRKLLGKSAVVLVAGTVAAAAWRSSAVRDRFADYRTAVGQRREVVLPDGAALTLNTGTAVDVAYSSSLRLLQLRDGEMLVTTAPDPSGTHRPFMVATRHGRVVALGTRFTMRVGDGWSEVAVLEKAVRVQPAVPGAPSVLVQAGQHVRFDARQVGPLQTNDAGTAAWQYGAVIAVDMPLSQLVAELARYRPGYLGCDAEVAGLRVSGAFPIGDTDRALDTLARTFPLQISRRTDYWVTVRARD